jgi:short subunit dehydrogenase-like uncharacterized protein
VAPFVMAAINTRNVHRSNFLLAMPGAPTSSTTRCWSPGRREGRGDGQRRGGRQVLASDGGPKPGEGPSREEREAGFYDVLFLGTGRRPDPARGRQGDRDPGYGSTSKMIAEAGVCLLQDRQRHAGGIWTPASAMGQRLIDRLQAHAGLTFAVEGGRSRS